MSKTVAVLIDSLLNCHNFFFGYLGASNRIQRVYLKSSLAESVNFRPLVVDFPECLGQISIEFFNIVKDVVAYIGDVGKSIFSSLLALFVTAKKVLEFLGKPLHESGGTEPLFKLHLSPLLDELCPESM